MSANKKDPKAPPTTLRDEDMQSEQDMGRRSALVVLGAGALGAASSVIGACVVGQQPGYYAVQSRPVVVAQPPPQQVVVQQPGVQYRTGITDSDGGPYADPAGNGRGGQRGVSTGITDSDGGPYADPAGQGRGTFGRGGATGITDSDGGPYADPAGNGRGNTRLGYTGITDSDGGPYADPAGHGRGHR